MIQYSIMENTDHGLGRPDGETIDRLWRNYRAFFVAVYEVTLMSWIKSL